MTTQNSGKHRHFATTAIACFAYFALALLLLHLLRPDYAPATTWISGYAVGPYGWIMTTARNRILDRLPDLRFDPAGVDEAVIEGYAFRGPRSLPVLFTPS